MALATFSVRMDEQLKVQFEDLCDKFGMNMSTAINVFARAVVREKKIPFEITDCGTNASYEAVLLATKILRAEAAQNGSSDMTLEEINEEIRKSRQGE